MVEIARFDPKLLQTMRVQMSSSPGLFIPRPGARAK
jgi:hypothetical protein